MAISTSTSLPPLPPELGLLRDYLLALERGRTALTEVELLGVKDGVNVTFTSPVPVLFGANGKPRALLTWRRARQFYVASDPTGPGHYTLSGVTVMMGEAPQAGDYLAWDIIDV